MKSKRETLQNCGGIKHEIPKVKNGITELVFILDRSGSMMGLREDTVGGFNSMIERQKQTDGECYVSTVLFNGESEVLHDRVKLSSVPTMSIDDYIPYGSTALIDAIGDAVKHIRNVHKYARPEDVPERTMFVITTDGEENSSSKYRSSEVKKMIKQRKEEDGWEFLFIGANIDAVETAARYGIGSDRAVNYRADSEGTHVLYKSVSKCINDYRSCSAPISDDWGAEIESDCKKRSSSKK